MCFWLDARNLNAKECHFILPLVMWTFIMHSVAFISSTSQDRIKLIVGVKTGGSRVGGPELCV